MSTIRRRRGGASGSAQPEATGHEAFDFMRSALSLVSVFGPPLTVATALLVYFGWARSDEQARELGLEESVLGMSTRDYILRSIDTLFVPLLVVGCAGIAWLLAHERISAEIDHRRHLPEWRKTFHWLRFSWLALPALGLIASLVWPAWLELIVPVAMAVGILVTSYASVMCRRIDNLTQAEGDHGHLARWHWPLMKLLVGALVALTIFWELSTFAGVVGRGLAHQVVAGLDQRTGVVVYSKQDIQLAGPGVTKYRITEPTSAYGFRYDGLRLLQRTGDKFYLLPVGWQSPADGVIALPDDASVRVEFSTAGQLAQGSGG